MEKRDSRKHQNHLSNKLIPIQSLKSDVNFCSLAELKTCLDSAQINSFQKESKDSILKLLDGDRDSRLSDERRCLYALWKNNQRDNNERWNAQKLKSKVVTNKTDAYLNSPKPNVHPPSPLTKKSPSKEVAVKIEPACNIQINKSSSSLFTFKGKSVTSTCQTSIATDISVYTEDEDYVETDALSDAELQIEEENDDEFAELSDIDGEDSAVNSQSNSSVSWTSLDACKQDEVSESVTTTDSGIGSDADISNGLHSAVTQSFFKYCPPVLYFPSDNEKLTKLPRVLHRQLKWKMSTITPNVVKNVIARAGFVPSTKRREWIGYWGKHMKASAFRNILPHQKVNHFPGTFEIGRKDKLWKNLYRAQIKYSKKEYDFIPLTYCLPSEWKTFKRYWDETGHKHKWIIKPPASARGIGIKVIHKLNQIPRKRSIIVQRYLANPYLINGRKFDLRMYVYVPSYDPLTIYLCDNGLVRFATSKYSHSSKSLSNRFAHLTNYSVNKNNDAYIKNEDATGTDSHKWAIKSLWNYLEIGGYDVQDIKNKIKNIIIKTIIASVPTVSSLSKSHCRYKHTCHELFGFDIFLDHHLKPWLIEVNISPSLHTNSTLDKSIKYSLVKDIFNTAGYLLPSYPVRSKSTSTKCSTPTQTYTIAKLAEESEQIPDKHLYFNSGVILTSDEKSKHAYFTQRYGDVSIMDTILDRLTPDDIRTLMKFEDECSRSGDLELVFPTDLSAKYHKYFNSPKYYDLLILQWRKKYAKDPGKGIARLQKLAETQIQFCRAPTNPEHLWAKPRQSHLNVKRPDKSRDKLIRVYQDIPPPRTKHRSLTTRSRASHSAPASVERTKLQCNVVRTCPSSAHEDVAHLPSVEWQSNYYRAKRSLSKLKLVKFQNWEPSNRKAAKESCFVTKWVPP